VSPAMETATYASTPRDESLSTISRSRQTIGFLQICFEG
jgi:hypothetical protein